VSWFEYLLGKRVELLQAVIGACLQIFLPQPVDQILTRLIAQSVDQTPSMFSPTVREPGAIEAQIIYQV
jgi:hypothetical protein